MQLQVLTLKHTCTTGVMYILLGSVLRAVCDGMVCMRRDDSRAIGPVRWQPGGLGVSRGALPASPTLLQQRPQAPVQQCALSVIGLACIIVSCNVSQDCEACRQHKTHAFWSFYELDAVQKDA